MPESLRSIFTRSSGVFPRPFNCDGKHFFHHLVEFWPAWHAQSFQFSADDGQRQANGTPFVEESFDLIDCGRLIGFRQEIRHVLHGELFDVVIGVDGRLGLLAGESFSAVSFLVRESFDGTSISAERNPSLESTLLSFAIL